MRSLWLDRGIGVNVEPEDRDVGSSIGADDHVVAVILRYAREVSMKHGVVAIKSKKLFISH